MFYNNTHQTEIYKKYSIKKNCTTIVTHVSSLTNNLDESVINFDKLNIDDNLFDGYVKIHSQKFSPSKFFSFKTKFDENYCLQTISIIKELKLKINCLFILINDKNNINLDFIK